MKKINLLLTLALTTTIGSMNADKIDDAIAQAELEMQEMRKKATQCSERFSFEENFGSSECAYQLIKSWGNHTYTRNGMRVLFLKIIQKMTDNEKHRLINILEWPQNSDYYGWTVLILELLPTLKGKIKLDNIITMDSLNSFEDIIQGSPPSINARKIQAIDAFKYDFQYFLDILNP